MVVVVVVVGPMVVHVHLCWMKNHASKVITVKMQKLRQSSG